MQRRVRGSVVMWSVVLSVACGEGDQVLVEEGGGRDGIVGGSVYTGLPAVGAFTVDGEEWCTGTLVEKRKVLTAAHCLEDITAAQLRFVIGPRLDAPQAVLAVAAIKRHPSYDSRAITNDIGYATLAEDAPVEPLGVVTAMDAAWVGRTLFFVGYGVTSGARQSGAGVKRAVDIPISAVRATTFEYETRGKNTCSGDSGGPAFLHRDNQYLVAGVTSYGDPGCTDYGVDTRVDKYLGFLALQAPPAAPAADPCAGETYAGRCQSNTVVWCEDGTVQRLACGTSTCGLEAERQIYNCL